MMAFMEELYRKYLACGGRVTTDSRAVRGGEIFFALRGENFDGNDYAAGALESGAAWAVVNDDATLPADARFIRASEIPSPDENSASVENSTS